MTINERKYGVKRREWTRDFPVNLSCNIRIATTPPTSWKKSRKCS